VQAEADAKLAKNQAKRNRKKANRSKGKGKASDNDDEAAAATGREGPVIKKRRLLGGDAKEIKFGLAGDEAESGDDAGGADRRPDPDAPAVEARVAESNNISIVDND
jgi:hypothetical protein